MLQIIGTKKDKDTAKAERYLKECRIEYQFVDLDRYELKKKEWDSIFNSVDDLFSLIDKNSAYYKKKGYDYLEYDPKEELIEHPELLKKPVLRRGNKAVIGVDKDFMRNEE